MNIVVLVKQTFDTEEKIVLEGGAVSEDGVKFVINPYDEYAVEQGILMRDAAGAGKVTVLSAGPARAAEALRTALAMGADEAVLIDDSRIPADEYSVSRVLAAYLTGLAERGEAADVVLGGNFSVDNGAGQVAVRLAGLLGLPHVASVTKLEVSGGVATAHRDAEGDTEIVEVSLPALFTAQQGLNEPRYPSLPGIMKAKKKPFATIGLDDLGLTVEQIAAKTERISVSLPPARAAGKKLAGDAAAQAAELARLLREEAKVL
ncbi:electron transfer flavoprotein subunit beta/FixA family protein [Paenibacillus alkalitolerans]|uniref:electron transfer flavoprotein subunit beta/FixA family protein n=1 Tax=Paenibacillus alkalitolerans TaxID=2799335 RepID=UPI0018F3C598|nr:electron transfer flavoprotein subunit beta/FixA family protein [Paenibacillus alkalitolerans]